MAAIEVNMPQFASLLVWMAGHFVAALAVCEFGDILVHKLLERMKRILSYYQEVVLLWGQQPTAGPQGSHGYGMCKNEPACLSGPSAKVRAGPDLVTAMDCLWAMADLEINEVLEQPLR